MHIVKSLDAAYLAEADVVRSAWAVWLRPRGASAPRDAPRPESAAVHRTSRGKRFVCTTRTPTAVRVPCVLWQIIARILSKIHSIVQLPHRALLTPRSSAHTVRTAAAAKHPLACIGVAHHPRRYTRDAHAHAHAPTRTPASRGNPAVGGAARAVVPPQGRPSSARACRWAVGNCDHRTHLLPAWRQ